MKSRSRRIAEVALAGLTFLVACRRDAPTCEGVGVTLAPAAWASDSHMAEHVASRLARHCRDDHWSPEAIRCVHQTTRGDACAAFLTPEQSKRLALDSPFARAVPLPPTEGTP